MQIRGMHPAADETLHPPLGMRHPPRGGGARARLQGRAVELVAAHPRPGRRHGVVAQRHRLPVAQREPFGHPGVGGQHPAHRPAVYRAGQIQQPGALRGHRCPARGQGGHRRPQRRVRRQLRCVHLGEAAADHQPPGAGRELLVAQRIEGHHLGARRGQQLGMLGIREGERGAARDGDPRPVAAGPGTGLRGRVPGHVRQRRHPARQRQQRLQIAALAHPRGQLPYRLHRLGAAFGDRHQAQMPRGRTGLPGTPQRAQHRHPRRVHRLAQQRLMTLRADLVEDHPGQPHLRIPGREAVHQRGHRPGLRGGVHHQHHRRPQQLRHLRRRRQFAPTGRAVEQPHHALHDRQVRARRAVQEQRGDPLRAAQIRVQIAAGAAGGQGVVARVDVVRPDLVRRDRQTGLGEGRHQAGGDGRLARAGGGRGDDETGDRGPGHAQLTIRYPAGPSGRRPWGA